MSTGKTIKFAGKINTLTFYAGRCFFSVRQTDFGMESPRGRTCHMMADVL